MSLLETSPVPRLTSDMELNYSERRMLVSGRANPGLAHKIGEKLGVEVSEVISKTFSNGEVYCRFEESVRGADVFIVQSTCGNPRAGLSANDALMELMFMVD